MESIEEVAPANLMLNNQKYSSIKFGSTRGILSDLTKNLPMVESSPRNKGNGKGSFSSMKSYF